MKAFADIEPMCNLEHTTVTKDNLKLKKEHTDISLGVHLMTCAECGRHLYLYTEDDALDDDCEKAMIISGWKYEIVDDNMVCYCPDCIQKLEE